MKVNMGVDNNCLDYPIGTSGAGCRLKVLPGIKDRPPPAGKERPLGPAFAFKQPGYSDEIPIEELRQNPGLRACGGVVDTRVLRFSPLNEPQTAKLSQKGYKRSEDRLLSGREDLNLRPLAPHADFLLMNRKAHRMLKRLPMRPAVTERLVDLKDLRFLLNLRSLTVSVRYTIRSNLCPIISPQEAKGPSRARQKNVWCATCRSRPGRRCVHTADTIRDTPCSGRGREW